MRDAAERMKCCAIVSISDDVVHHIWILVSAIARVYIIKYDDILR